MKLVLSIIIGYLPSISGFFFRPDAWYESLNKSPFTPPAGVFPVVWTILYTSLGLALYFFVRSLQPLRYEFVLVVFGVHLLLNFAWSMFFFGWHCPVLGFIDICFLLLTLWYILFVFYPTSTLSFVILMPYTFWLIFAAFLNFEIIRLN